MPDLETVTLRDPSSSLTATYVPGAGMIGTSLSDDGVELLGQRRGLEAYLSAGKTMGIPLLYPWANRLSAKTYEVDGDTVTLAPDAYGVRADNNGLPIHGLLAAYPGWRAEQVSDQKLTAELDFGAHDELLASFPFPHRVELTVELADRTLTVSTTVTPTSDKPVPLAYGFHPYLQLPDVPREQWILTTPTMRHLALDDTGHPHRRARRPERVRPQRAERPSSTTTASTRSPKGRCSRSAGGGSPDRRHVRKGLSRSATLRPEGKRLIASSR